jgi:hypothetical protein
VIHVALILTVAFALAGCATTARNTPSGRPEVTIQGNLASTKAKVMSGMINMGFTLRDDSGSRLVFEKRGDVVIGLIIQPSFLRGCG